MHDELLAAPDTPRSHWTRFADSLARLGPSLRSLGLAARYVSGYILTTPPAGTPRLVGADASHAWLAVWLGDAGWVDVDPTNDPLPSDQHVTVAWGRDYADVSPLRGVVLGGGDHRMTVAVDLTPLE